MKYLANGGENNCLTQGLTVWVKFDLPMLSYLEAQSLYFVISNFGKNKKDLTT